MSVGFGMWRCGGGWRLEGREGLEGIPSWYTGEDRGRCA